MYEISKSDQCTIKYTRYVEEVIIVSDEETEVHYTLSSFVNYKLQGVNKMKELKKELQDVINLAVEINHEKFGLDKVQLDKVINNLENSLKIL